MLDSLSDRLLKNWPSYLPDHRRPGRLHYLGITGSREGGATTFLGFGDEGKEPLFAVKVHRTPHAGERVQTEWQILKTLKLKEGISESIPRPILADEIDGIWFLAQGILPGVPMPISLDPPGRPEIEMARRHFDLATDWLIRAASQNGKPEVTRWHQTVLKRVSDYIEIFEPEPKTRSLLEGLVRDASEIPSVFIVHGDYCRHNLLVRPDGSLGVLDWTFAQWDGAPLQDLFFFATTYFLQVRRKTGLDGFLDAFAYSFLSRNSYSNLIREKVSQYLETLGLPISLAPKLFVFYLVTHGVVQYRLNVAAAQRGHLPRFSTELTAERGVDHRQAAKEHMWKYFLDLFTQRQDDFILK